MITRMETPAPSATAAPPKPRRRLWKVLLLVVGIPFALLLAAVFLGPYAIGLTAVRTQIAERASAQLGAPCRIDTLAWSWSHGVRIAGLEIGNPPGFPQERPALRLREATLDVALGTLFGGRVDVKGDIAGLELFVEQRADGQTNLQALGQGSRGSGAGGRDGGGSGKRAGDDTGLANVQANVTLRESGVEIRREGQLLESLSKLSGNLEKPFGMADLTAQLLASLLPLAGGEPGQIQMHAAVDPATGQAKGALSLVGVDLHRFEPLVETFAPGKLTALAGVANGDVQVEWRAADDLTVAGQLRIDSPVVGGPALDGMTLTAPHWHLSPRLGMAPGADATAPRVTTDGFVLDLGFLQVEGLAADAKEPALPNGERPNFAWHVDTDGLGDLSKRLPDWLQLRGGKWHGTARVPLDEVLADPSKATQLVRGRFEVLAEQLTVAGNDFSGAALSGTLSDGALAIATAPTMQLAGGGFTLSCNVDASQLENLPLSLSLRWNGGRLSGNAIQLLRYAVPLFAGVDANTAQLSGLCDLELNLSGPARPAEGESVLQLLNRWSGDGTVGLRQATVAPAGQLAGLLAPMGALSQLLGPQATLGDGGKLAIDDLSAPFRFSAGAVETTATKWLAKGNAIGLSGKVRLDGGIDYGIDLSALLAGHKDGQRVLQALGGALPAARLAGSLTAPTLGLPDLSHVAQKLLESEVKNRGVDLLKKGLEDLLKPKPR